MNLTDKQIERFAEYFPEIQYYTINKEENSRTLEQFELIAKFSKLKNNEKTPTYQTDNKSFSLGLIVGILTTLLILFLGSSIIPNMSNINQASALYHLKQDLTKYWYPVSEKTPEIKRAKNLLRFSEIRHREAKTLTISNAENKSELIKKTLLKGGDNYRAALQLNPQLKSEKVVKTLANINAWAEENEEDEIVELTEGLDLMYKTLITDN